MHRTCTVHFSGIAPYSASRVHREPELSGESKDAYEERTWPLKAHTIGNDVVVPGMAFKFCLDRAVKVIGRQVPGKGKATYTKFFESGVMCLAPVPIAKTSEIQKETVHCHSNGTRGSGSRVWRHFPTVREWAGSVEFQIIADQITPEIFEEAARYAGQFVGIGRFRPENSGYFGRFLVNKFDWVQVA